MRALEAGVPIVSLILFGVPSVIAWCQYHHNRVAIMTLNALVAFPALLTIIRGETLGTWMMITFLMWSAALVWSATAPRWKEREEDETP